jgi:hypothetical protein
MILLSDSPQAIQRSAARTTVPDPTSNRPLATYFTVVTWLDFDFISVQASESRSVLQRVGKWRDKSKHSGWARKESCGLLPTLEQRFSTP